MGPFIGVPSVLVLALITLSLGQGYNGQYDGSQDNSYSYGYESRQQQQQWQQQQRGQQQQQQHSNVHGGSNREDFDNANVRDERQRPQRPRDKLLIVVIDG